MMRSFLEEHGVHITQAWGMTETSPLGTLARPPAGLTPEREWELRCSQGCFVAAVQARLVDSNGSEQPWDGASPGELEVRGPWVTGSYYRADAADKFYDGWLRTGDVGTITSAGFLQLSDRSKDVIESGGEWISSVELENHVMEHPGVLEAAVIGVPDPRWDERPLAAVVLRQGAAVTAEQLRGFLADRARPAYRWTRGGDSGSSARYCRGVFPNQRRHERLKVLCSVYPSRAEIWLRCNLGSARYLAA